MKTHIILFSLLFSASVISMDPKVPYFHDRIQTLVEAARQEDRDVIELVLEQSKKQDTFCDDVTSTLEQLASSNYAKGIRLLFECGVDPAFKDAIGGRRFPSLTPFLIAVLYGWKKSVKVFLKHSLETEITGENGETAFVKAISRGWPNIAGQLLAHGADPDKKNWLNQSCLTICETMLKYLETNKSELSGRMDVEQRKKDYEACRRLLLEALKK